MEHFAASLPIYRLAGRFSPYVASLQAILAAMDEAYSEVAEARGFFCSGCEDNCCRSRFYHHTYLELFYLRHGWETLDRNTRTAVRVRAEDVCRQKAADASGRHEPRQMCPLNDSGLCVLYPYRPMICRLHGIPHLLRRPDGRKVLGPGCDAFNRQCGSRTDVVLERTPHYAALAGLEQEFRRAAGLGDKMKLTVAGMILRFTF